MLIGELVPETLRYLRDNPEAPEHTEYLHVLVDEYQDLNRAEQELLDLLAANGSLSIIGDEDQSIYSFKHAHPEGISNFNATHAGTHDEALVQCRRSPHRVVAMANALIANNVGRLPRALEPFPGNPEGEIYVVQWQNPEEEARGLARFIRHRIDGGTVDAGRVLVLTPRRQFGYAIRDALDDAGVPAHSFFQEEALEGDPTEAGAFDAQEAFALLCLLAEPDDRIALRAWCGFGSPTLRREAWRRLRGRSAESGASPREILQRLATRDERLPNVHALVERWELLRTRLDALADLRNDELINALFPEDAVWSEPLRAGALALGLEEGQVLDAIRLRDGLRTSISQPELPTDVDYVRVMSFHKSKGLTAHLVVVAGCMHGLIPTIPRDLTPEEETENLREQRRLFYVAITRTRQALVLSSAARLRRDLAHRIGARVGGNAGRYNIRTIASGFLSEFGGTVPASVRGVDFLAATVPASSPCA